MIQIEKASSDFTCCFCASYLSCGILDQGTAGG